MHRFRDRRPSGTFRGAELPRLLTLLVMLGVLAMLIARAGDPNTWRWLAPGGEDAAADLSPPNDSVEADTPVAAGPIDDDPQERDAAREEFQAITDKAPLATEEMPAYWRLMAWQQRQSTAEMQQRAATEVSFRQFRQQPQKWRGQLVQIPLHVKQTARQEHLAENPLGMNSVEEAWGWTTDSQPYSYWVVCPRLPAGMPTGANLQEEATFVGYFLKLISYEDHQGKVNATPLLIGRLVWHPSANKALARGENVHWTWYLAGGLLVLFVARWGLVLAGSGKRPGYFPRRASTPDEGAIDAWLEGAQRDRDDHGGNPSSQGTNGAPTARGETTGPPAGDGR